MNFLHYTSWEEYSGIFLTSTLHIGVKANMCLYVRYINCL